MSDDTFDMLASLRERHVDGKLVFPAGPVIADEIESLRARLEKAEGDVVFMQDANAALREDAASARNDALEEAISALEKESFGDSTPHYRTCFDEACEFVRAIKDKS